MTCICHPAHRCGRCDVPTRSELAVSILQLKARDEGKECCADTDGESVCVIRKGHAGEHRFELISKVVPFS